MRARTAREDDLGLLADWNHQLIADEGHRNPMGVDELRERMAGWLDGEYTAIVFEEDEDVAYALFKEREDEIYLRQFFVRRDRRQQGLGTKAMAILSEEMWPDDKRFTVDVLAGNPEAIAFWRSLGYRAYCLSLEIRPEHRE